VVSCDDVIFVCDKGSSQEMAKVLKNLSDRGGYESLI